MSDAAAAKRLSAEVERRYREHTGGRFTKSGLSARSGIGRPTLDNWLEKGVMPPVEGMARLAEAVGAEPADLWLRWLGLEVPDPGLGQIAKEISELRRTLAAAGGRTGQVQDAQVAIDAARVGQPEAPASVQTSGLAASARPRKPAAGTRRR